MMDFSRAEILNPKRDDSSNIGRAGWYPYYAGFSLQFATRLLSSLPLPADALVLDPWNGSGTTTASAAGLGISSFGIDLNPVMIVVARARLLSKRVRPSLVPLALSLVPKGTYVDLTDDDPLLVWLVPRSVRAVRSIEASVQRHLCGFNSPRLFCDWKSQPYSDLTAFYYLALFRQVRKLLKPFCGSNPTWIKMPSRNKDRIDIPVEEVFAGFITEVSLMTDAIQDDCLERDGRADLLVASSSALPLSDASVSLVLCSPPYCTRIDYVMATLPELAVLGFKSNEHLCDMRKEQIGTPTIRDCQPDSQNCWGPSCQQFLRRVREHGSKASAGYYFKTHSQYFDGIFQSLKEILRVLRLGGGACLVVQDSWYKDVHNDVPKIVSEMAEGIGLQQRRRQDFAVNRNMVRVNSGTRLYRKPSTATETVLCFKKPE